MQNPRTSCTIQLKTARLLSALQSSNVRPQFLHPAIHQLLRSTSKKSETGSFSKNVFLIVVGDFGPVEKFLNSSASKNLLLMESQQDYLSYLLQKIF